MGTEQLEESESEPMFLNCKPKLQGKMIALFAPMVGATVSGCEMGRKLARKVELI